MEHILARRPIEQCLKEMYASPATGIGKGISGDPGYEAGNALFAPGGFNHSFFFSFFEANSITRLTIFTCLVL
jgi:hypothetical protein